MSSPPVWKYEITSVKYFLSSGSYQVVPKSKLSMGSKTRLNKHKETKIRRYNPEFPRFKSLIEKVLIGVVINQLILAVIAFQTLFECEYTTSLAVVLGSDVADAVRPFKTHQLAKEYVLLSSAVEALLNSPLERTSSL